MTPRSSRALPGAKPHRLLPAAVAVLAVLGLAACSQDIQVRGNLPDPEVVASITPGVDTREDIARMFGSPLTLSTFQDRKWYYIGQKVSQFAFLGPKVLERQVLEVTFDQRGLVQAAKTYSLADGRDIDPVDRTTPTEGREITILQQFLGNLGRYKKTK